MARKTVIHNHSYMPEDGSDWIVAILLIFGLGLILYAIFGLPTGNRSVMNLPTPAQITVTSPNSGSSGGSSNNQQ